MSLSGVEINFQGIVFDISSDIVPRSAIVYLSSRSGTWMAPRTTLFGLPIEIEALAPLLITPISTYTQNSFRRILFFSIVNLILLSMDNVAESVQKVNFD
jgi:hypothetical protein